MLNLLDETSNILGLEPQEFKQFVQLKRFAERWYGDPNFRQQLEVDPDRAIADYNLNVNLEDTRFIWDTDQTSPLTPIVEKIAQIINEQQQSSQTLRQEIHDSVRDPRIKAWRQRQIARVTSQTLGEGPNGAFPVSFELSKGCSVGCWFCCVSASGLTETFAYTPENARLWQSVLNLMHDKLGMAASEGFCYWATDPLDNSDYEHFCRDFYEILGGFPSTTTALALKNPERTRALLKLSQEKGCTNVRFSVLSLKMLDQIHQAFTPEELNFVHLVLQNKEAAKRTKAAAGRARNYRQKDPSVNNQFVDKDIAVSCVSGFLFNMVDRTIQLISPCVPNERWPSGHRVHQECRFSNGDELKQVVEQMIGDHMPLAVRPEDIIRFRCDLNYKSLPQGFQLSTRYKKFKFQNAPYIRELGEIINKKANKAQEIAELLNIFSLPSENTYYYLNQLFERGLLDDEPPL